MKRIVVTGGSGYIGSALSARLLARGDQVTVMTRGAASPPESRANPRKVNWDPYRLGEWAKALDGADAVVNLAGERAVGVRYTDAAKSRIRASRVITTQNVAAAILQASKKPSVLVSMSGVDYYAPGPKSQTIDETGEPGSDFLARVCIEWEAAAEPVAERGVRLVCTRMGVVFGPNGGSLAVMSLPFKLFVGGHIGDGTQGVSWIHLDDAVSILVACIDDASLSGKINVTSPNPASNDEISRTIAETLHRPSWLSAPSFGLKLLFGEGAKPILSGRWVVPGVMLQHGFAFRNPALKPALVSALRSEPAAGR